MKSKQLLMILSLAVIFLSANLFAVTDEETAKIYKAMPSKPVVQPAKERTMLVFSLCNGFKHSSIPYWNKALDIMSEKTGAFKVVHSTDMNIFTPQALKRFDAICFNNTTKLVPNQNQQKAILDFVKEGGGIVGIHAATDNFYQWPEGMQMMGSVFKGHPWTANGTWAVKLDEKDHPLMKPFNGRNFKINDEIYRTESPLYSRSNQRVLMSLDMSDDATKNAKGIRDDDADTGITWIKPVGKGRLFYCSLGHNPHITWNKPVLEHYLAGIQYALGDYKVDDRPLGQAKLDTARLDSLLDELKTYDWDKSRASLVKLSDFIKEYNTNKDALKSIELKLADRLNSNMSLAAKDFVCRQLSVIGSDASVAALINMLDDPKTADMARYALERIPSPAVDRGLLKKLDAVVDTKTKIGIITSLGIRKSDTAVARLAKAAAGGNTAKAKAAVEALGYIGSDESVKALQNLPQNERTSDALLNCAESLLRHGQTEKARAIYHDLYAAGGTSVISAGGLIGILKTGANPELLTSALKSTDPVIRAAAIEQVADVQDVALLKVMAGQMQSLPDQAKIQMLAALAANTNKIGRIEAQQLLSGSNNKSVRLAACQALSVLGDASTSVSLAKYAGQTSDRDEKNAAREALYLLSGKDVDGTIVNTIMTKNSDIDDSTIIELIRAAAQRPIPSAFDVLLKTAKSPNRKISSESIRDLQMLATSAQLEDLVMLLIEKPGSAMENAVVVVAGKIEEQNSRARTILEKYDTVKSDSSKASLLRVLGKIGDPGAVSLLKKEYASENPVIQTAAFRAMTQWPGTDFIQEMKKLCQSSQDMKTKILAYRAYIRMLDDSATDENQQQVIDGLITAYDMAPKPDEQKIVIGVLGHFSSTKALNFVKGALTKKHLKNEAEVSLIQICEKLQIRNPLKAKSTLEDIIKTTENEATLNKARKVYDNIANLESFVMDWKVSGPYMSKNKTGAELFDIVFAPEKNTQSCQWKNTGSLITNNQQGIIDLNRLAKGNNRVAYLKTSIIADEAIPAILGIGSDDGAKIWLNDKLVYAKNVIRPVNVGQDKVNVQLKKGPNKVLVKVTQGRGDWGFSMKINGLNGNLLSGIEVDSEK